MRWRALTVSPVVKTRGSVIGVRIVRRLRRIGVMMYLTNATLQRLVPREALPAKLTLSKTLIFTLIRVRCQELALAPVELVNGFIKRRLTRLTVSINR